MEIVILVLLAVILLAVLGIWLQTNAKISAFSERLRDTQDGTGRYFGQIQQDIGKVLQVGEQMREVGQGISNLENLLRPPQPRGGMGELMLGELLAQILPPNNYRLQHAFRSGERVDAAIVLGPALVPVDAKFPLPSFERILACQTEEERARAKKEFVRTVKGHIDTIATKYILPDEGTFDFALMYIPAEAVYYETIIKEEALREEKSLFDYAIERKVIPVSPNSFYAYLQVIVRGLRGMQVEKRAQEILGHLSRLQGDLNKFREDFTTLGTHLQHARSKYEEADRKLDRFGDRLSSVSEAVELPPSEGEKPALPEGPSEA